MGWGGRATDRRQRRADRAARQLPEHADRGASRRATRGSTSAYRLNPDGGGAGRTPRRARHHARDDGRGRRDRRQRPLRPLAIAPWGLFGGERRRVPRRSCVAEGGGRPSRPSPRPFGTVSDTKFSNVRLERGDQVLLRSPVRRRLRLAAGARPERVRPDVREGFVSAEAARERYGVALTADGDGGRRRDRPAARGGRLMPWVERVEPWHRIDVALLRGHGTAPARSATGSSSTRAARCARAIRTARSSTAGTCCRARRALTSRRRRRPRR